MSWNFATSKQHQRNEAKVVIHDVYIHTLAISSSVGNMPVVYAYCVGLLLCLFFDVRQCEGLKTWNEQIVRHHAFFVYTRPRRCHLDTNKTMKKLFLTVAIVAMTMLTSCKKSNADLIKDYDSVCKELVEATKNGDFAKVATLSEKGQKLENELRERELTDEEKSQLQEIQSKAASGIVSGAADGISNMIDSATDATETLSAVAVGDDNPNGVVE